MKQQKEEQVYLRALRVQSGITQGDIAALSGYTNRASISKLEDHSQSLTLLDVTVFSHIFNVSLLRFVYTLVKTQKVQVLDRARRLLRMLEDHNTPEMRNRIDFVRSLIDRLDNRSKLERWR